ncbi:MAG TPA: CBS domain-containing protein [Thermoflexales bacterium]|nr:CBS domain-containing protein [Thermoflexales bacterium]HQW37047.1 CBS domain-containing protein [Thermoflexales bacterium]HQZ22160.1 CBS domain-containing protein [Thermoflexales bacterium]
MMDNLIVRNWMTADPVTVTPKTTLPDAHDLMKRRRIRRLPVMEGDKLVGIVTLGDVREASPSDATTLSIYEMNYLLSRLTVEKIMSKNVLTITPTTPIREAAGMMLLHKVSGLPVMENDRLVGIITESDIFRVVVKNL